MGLTVMALAEFKKGIKALSFHFDQLKYLHHLVYAWY